VRQRQTFKLNTKGENMAPLAFQHDPDGTYHELATQLRSFEWRRPTFEDEQPVFESLDEDEGKTRHRAKTKRLKHLPAKERLLPHPLARARQRLSFPDALT
jgi:hypothetical protein